MRGCLAFWVWGLGFVGRPDMGVWTTGQPCCSRSVVPSCLTSRVSLPCAQLYRTVAAVPRRLSASTPAESAPRHANSPASTTTALAASYRSAGSRSFRQSLASSLKRPSDLLERVRSLNDGRLVDKFDAFDRKMSKVCFTTQDVGALQTPDHLAINTN